MPFNETYNTSFAPYTDDPTDMVFINNKRRALEGLLWFPEDAIKAIDPYNARRDYPTGYSPSDLKWKAKCPLGQACYQMVNKMYGSDMPKNPQYRATVSEIMESDKPPPAAIQTVLNTYYNEFSQTEYIPRTHSLAGKYLLGEELPKGLSKERYDDLEAFTIYWDDGKITRNELKIAIRKRLEHETTFKFTIGG
jgi:hypothetical protein|tara:strand:- start:7648 stop:8229 length:582 start_codon:yes stop_codon:yes gene_type:complete